MLGEGGGVSTRGAADIAGGYDTGRAEHVELDLPPPDFPEREEYGEVRLTAHQILLPHVVRCYSEGYSPEMLWEQIPTLKLSHIHKVIAFRPDHEDAEIELQAAAHPRSPP